jgi:hypothetical protein
VKGYIASHNVGRQNMSHLIPLTQKAFEEVSNENWAAVCTHVKKVEQDYTDKEPILDGRMDEFILHVNTESSDEEGGVIFVRKQKKKKILAKLVKICFFCKPNTV